MNQEPIHTNNPVEILRIMRASLVAQREAVQDLLQYMDKQFQVVEHLLSVHVDQLATPAPVPATGREAELRSVVIKHAGRRGAPKRILMELNERGVLTSAGNRWNYAAARGLLKRYAPDSPS